MRYLVVVTLVAFSSFVFSQIIDIGCIDTLPEPVISIQADQNTQTVHFNQTAAIEKDITDLRENPIGDCGKGSLRVRTTQKRDGPIVLLNVTEPACTHVNGTLYGDIDRDSEDARVQKFLSNTTIHQLALDSSTPTNYTLVFQNLTNSSQAYGYLGYSVLSSYDVPECAAKCTNTAGCQGFNVYFERDPSQVPAPACPRPVAVVNAKCALWGGPISADNALNNGQYREQFHVVMSASNGYMLTSLLNQPLSAAAILAPLNCNGNDSYMGMRMFTDGLPFDPARCAAVCNETTQYAIAHPLSDPSKSPQLCTFYNTFVLSKNNVPQGQYCAMYSQSWNPDDYAKNTGQWDGEGNHFTISSSFFSSNVSTPVCPEDVATLREDYLAQVFCTSYISYTAPAAVTTIITSTTIYETCSAPTTTVSNVPIPPGHGFASEIPGSIFFPLTTLVTIETPTGTAPARLGKRAVERGEMGEAVVAVFADKFDDPIVTGTTSVEVTIPATSLSVPYAYTLATENASSQLRALANQSPMDRTASNPFATSPPAVNKRQGAPTPTLFSGRDYREISGACSQIVETRTQTSTYLDPAVTQSAPIDCSNFTTCADGSPPTLLSGSFYNTSYKVDDIYYTVNLPFEVCIYDTCSNVTHPSSNGLITLGNFTTAAYDNSYYGIPALGFESEPALYVYWDDLYIFPGHVQYTDYSICGPNGNRTVTFSWNIGHYLPGGPTFNGQVWSFSATFYEDQRGNVTLVYNRIPDNGTSASVGMQGRKNITGKS